MIQKKSQEHVAKKKNIHSLLTRNWPSWREKAVGIYGLGHPRGYMLLWANEVKFQGSQQGKATVVLPQLFFSSSGSRNRLVFKMDCYVQSRS